MMASCNSIGNSLPSSKKNSGKLHGNILAKGGWSIGSPSG